MNNSENQVDSEQTEVTDRTCSDQPFTRVKRQLPQMLLNNFLGGIVWGVGSVLGATVVVAAIGYLITTFKAVPFLGEIIAIFQDTLSP